MFLLIWAIEFLQKELKLHSIFFLFKHSATAASKISFTNEKFKNLMFYDSLQPALKHLSWALKLSGSFLAISTPKCEKTKDVLNTKLTENFTHQFFWSLKF